MVYRAKDIKHLEAMKNLEDTHPQEVDVKSLLNLNASEDSSFDENILKLCEGLRNKGFEKHARDLEEKFLNFKKADVHLYRVHDEDGDDLVEFAHPEGDTNMGDDDLGDVETIVSKHKKIVDVIQKEPTGKLASYVEQCKIVLAWDDGDEDSDIVKKYKDFAADWGTNLGRVAGSLNGFENAKLPNGKTVKDYNLEGARLAILGFAAKGGDPIQEWPTSQIINRTDAIIKEVYECIDQIDKAIDAGSSDFTNPKFPDEAWALLNPVREEFLSIYTSYNKDEGASKWHGQFASVEQIERTIQPLKEKLTSLKVRIDRHILAEPSLKSATGFLQWFETLEKNTIDKFIWELNNLAYASEKFRESMEQLHRGNEALIDANKLREFLSAANSIILQVDGVDKSTSDATTFLNSLNAAYTAVLNACKQSIQNANMDQGIKATILKHFEA